MTLFNWLGGALAALVLIALVVVGALAWLLTHPLD